jgi:hypothetical protein
VESETKSHVDQLKSPSGYPVAILRFEGDIASTSKDAVLGAYEGLPRETTKLILLDFTRVDYINSSGIALIIQPRTPGKPSSPSASRRTSPRSSPWWASRSTRACSPTRQKPWPRCKRAYSLFKFE